MIPFGGPKISHLVTFLSGHHWQSARRAGFHALSQSFLDAGWRVQFVTTGISRISLLKSDSRMAALRRLPRNCWTEAEDGVQMFLYLPAVHPIARQGLGWVTDRAFAWLYTRSVPPALDARLAQSDLVIFESNAALLLHDRVRRIAPDARLVYRISDDVRMLGMAPTITKAEENALPQFSLISVPSRHLLQRRFATFPQARFQPHGLDIDRLHAARAAPPLALERPACVSLGSTLFDHRMLAQLATARPDIWFHVVGAVEPGDLAEMPNIRWWGERPFEEALHIAASCDISAAFYTYREGVEYLAETSNKIAQYRYLGKPILGPGWLQAPLAHPGFVPVGADASGAVDQALELAGTRIDPGICPSWANTRDAIIAEVGPKEHR